MLVNDYIDRVFQRVSRGNPQKDSKIYRTAIQSTKDDARFKFAELSITKPWRELLEFDYSFPITNNHATFGTTTDILPQSIVACDKVTHGSVTANGTTLPFIPVQTRSDLELEAAIPNSPFAFYWPTLTGVDVAYGSTSLPGSLSVRAVKVPSFGNVDVRTESYLIDTGTILTIQRLLSEGNMTAEEAAKANA